MGATTTYALPYPEATDPADVPTDVRELAERTEVVLGTPANATRLTPTPLVEGRWLKVQGGVMIWDEIDISELAVRPAVCLTHNADYSVPNGISTINLNTEKYDTANLHTAGQAFIPLYAGYWLVWITGRFPAGGGGTAREIIADLAGTRILDFVAELRSGGAHDLTGMTVARVAATQNLSYAVYQDTGGAVLLQRVELGAAYMGKL